MIIRQIHSSQIFDSRSVPTLQTCVTLENGAVGIASVPSGASTGVHEAHELRDGGDPYGGKGVLRAAEQINTVVSRALKGMDVLRQRDIDTALIALDGTPEKQKLGANAILSVSMAAARAAANAMNLPLYRLIGGMNPCGTPLPMMNVLNGGLHADNNIDIQEFMIVPVGADSFDMAMRMGTDVYRALKALLKKAGHATAVGDEGGFAPNLSDDEEALKLLTEAIVQAGYTPGEEVAISLDCAAGGWAEGDHYIMPKRQTMMTRDQLIDRYADLAEKYELFSIEDPLGEEDFEGFAEITDRIGDDVLIVGDDLFTTNPHRLARGMCMGAANAILIKPNQIGTLTETLDVMTAARIGGYQAIVSHRSGETNDHFIADLAVGMGAPLFKAGAPARGERLAKYNRMLDIEWEISCRGMHALENELSSRL